MPGPYGDLTPARRLRGCSLSNGGVLVTLYGPDGVDTDEKNVWWNQPMGLRAYPEDGVGEGVAVLDGPYRELIIAGIPGLAVPTTQPKGSTWLHSLGSNPRALEVTDDKISLGAGATEKIIKGDTYLAAEKTFLDAINDALTGLPPIAMDPATTIALVNALRIAVLAIQLAAVAFANQTTYTSGEAFTK